MNITLYYINMENVVIVIQVAKNIIVSGCLSDFGWGGDSLP